MMLTLDGFPRNEEKYSRLLDFAADILEMCRGLGVDLIVDGSLAVFAYTKSQDIDVIDIDLACPEAAFPRIVTALDAKGIRHRQREWHVLQVLKDDLRVELGSLEYWYNNVPLECGTLQLGDCAVKIISLDSLKMLYKRGLDVTAKHLDEGNNRLKNQSYQLKCDTLNSIDSDGFD